jgi:hypothetical protein
MAADFELKFHNALKRPALIQDHDESPSMFPSPNGSVKSLEDLGRPTAQNPLRPFKPQAL